MGYTALLYACEKGHLEMIKYLVEHEANVNIVAKNKATPLMIACKVTKDNKNDIIYYLIILLNKGLILIILMKLLAIHHLFMPVEMKIIKLYNTLLLMV